MYSPQYLRHRQSLATTGDEESVKGGPQSRIGDGTSEHEEGEDGSEGQRRERDEEQLRLAGLRRRSLMMLFAWLGVGFIPGEYNTEPPLPI